MDKVLLTVDEGAEALSLGRSKFYELIQRGEIPTIKIGRATRVQASAIREWVERQVAETAAS